MAKVQMLAICMQEEQKEEEEKEAFSFYARLN